MTRAQAIVVMFIAGLIMGSCHAPEAPVLIPQIEPTMRVRDCRDSQIIRLMPNWIRDWDPPHYDHWT